MTTATPLGSSSHSRILYVPGEKPPLLDPKPLSSEELERHIQRLSKTSKKERKEVFADPVFIKQDALQVFMQRNYQKQVDKMKKQKEELQAEIDCCIAKTNASPRHSRADSASSPKLDHFIEKLYSGPMKKKETTLEQLDKKFTKSELKVCKRLTNEDQEEIMKRLYTSNASHKKALHDSIDMKWYGKPLETKKLSADESKSSVDRLSTQALEVRKQALAKIESSYYPVAPVKQKMQSADRAGVVSRLSQSKS